MFAACITCCVINNPCTSLDDFQAEIRAKTNLTSAVALLSSNKTWGMPKLIKLPREYRALFLKYHHKVTCV